MKNLEDKAKEIYLRMNSYSNFSEMNGIVRSWVLKKIKEGLQEYAEEYHRAELLRLNKSDVISSVCVNCNGTGKRRHWEFSEFVKCSVCQQTDL